MVKNYRFTGSVVTTVSVNDPEEDWVLFPNKVYTLDLLHPVVKQWVRKGLLKEVD
jgi:hypothetical protein